MPNIRILEKRAQFQINTSQLPNCDPADFQLIGPSFDKKPWKIW